MECVRFIAALDWRGAPLMLWRKSPNSAPTSQTVRPAGVIQTAPRKWTPEIRRLA